MNSNINSIYIQRQIANFLIKNKYVLFPNMLIRKTKKCYNAHKKYQFFTGYLATCTVIYI